MTQGPSCSYLGSSSAHFLEHHLDYLEASAERLQCDTHGRTNESTNMAQKWTFLFQHIFGRFIHIFFSNYKVSLDQLYVYIYICIHIYIYIYVCIYIYICHIYEYIDTQWTHPTLDRHCPSPAHRIQLCLARCSRCRRHGGAGDGGGDGGGDEKTEAEEEQNDGALGLLWDNCGIIIFCLIFHCG